MLPEVGQLVAEKYEIVGQLGQGGMAVVFAAHHTLLDKPVAMKFLSPELHQIPQLVERFLTEARAAARVDSVYVARVIDVGTLADGLPYIVMERLEGCNLEELIRAHKQLSVGEAVDHVLQALQGLAHAHVLGVIHRDLKPANLFLALQSDGSTLIKLLDFGIAKLVDEARIIAQKGQMMGSPMYMSPEQVRDPELVDPRADIWSIGIVLYELLSGKTPFETEAGGVGDTFAAVLGKTPERIRALRPDIPIELDAAVMRCLNQDPGDRFADVAELATALAPFGTGACTSLVGSIEQTLRQETRKFAATALVTRPPSSTGALTPVRVAFGDENDQRSTFLYGDSAASTLETNFLDLLGDALDAFAQVLVADDVITRSREDAVRLPRECGEEIKRLEGLASSTSEALARCPTGGSDSPSARVARDAITSMKSEVSVEIATLTTALNETLAALSTKEKTAREACATAFETLLLRHDMPGAVVELVLERANDRYAANLSGVAPYGLRWNIALEIPPGNPLSRMARLEKVARIEVDAPELTGWLKKEIKLRPQRLDRHYISALSIGTTSMTLKLREESDGTGEGFDLDVDLLTSRFQLARLGTEAPYDLQEADTVKVIALHDALLAVAKQLARSRKRVVQATLDGAPLWAEMEPRRVVERLVAVLAPITREIATHSPSATELVLKRVTAGDRREEVFVSKSLLLAKVQAIPDRVRAAVQPLTLAIEATSVRASQPSFPGAA